MFAKYLNLLLLCVLPFFSVGSYSQKTYSELLRVSAESIQVPDSLQETQQGLFKSCISPFVELGGKGFLSVNCDFRLKESHAFSVGFLFEGLAPNVMYYYLGGKRHRFEIGGGLTGGFSNELHLSVIVFHGAIGYRYQKKKGLFFRAGFTPFYSMFLNSSDRNVIYPFAGLSFGYSF